jgi:hypothetical protein
VDAGATAKRSFETHLDVPVGSRVVAAVALDRHGHEIGHSPTLRV